MTTRVMIVDDSIFIRVLLKNILENSNEDITVVKVVSNGLEALKEIKKNKDNIDVITMDIKMPEMDGLTSLREIMKIKKIPVVMISSLTKQGASETIEALKLGAIDFITKESEEKSNSLLSKEEEIVNKIMNASKANLQNDYIYEQITIQKRTKLKEIVAIGSSTGGPSALRMLLSNLKNDFDTPIIIAQHMPEGGFVEALCKSLDEICINKVKVIENGEIIKKNTIYICPGGYNVEVFKRGENIHLVLNKKEEKENYYKPSIDLLFASLSKINDVHKIGVILTGIGDDGSKGAKTLERSGGKIIAESKESAIIFGMPKKIIENQEINSLELSLNEIGDYLNIKR